MYLFLASLGLRCCVWAFPSCSKQGLPWRGGVWASHCGGFSCWGAWFLEQVGFKVLVARGLSCPEACWILLGQGSNLCPLHRKVDS